MVESLLTAPFSKSEGKMHKGRGGLTVLLPRSELVRGVPSPAGLARKDG